MVLIKPQNCHLPAPAPGDHGFLRPSAVRYLKTLRQWGLKARWERKDAQQKRGARCLDVNERIWLHSLKCKRRGQ